MTPSPKFTLNKADLQSQLRSALIFLGPSLLAFLIALSPAISALHPTTTGWIFLVVVLKYGLDQLTGLLRKFLDGKAA